MKGQLSFPAQAGLLEEKAGGTANLLFNMGKTGNRQGELVEAHLTLVRHVSMRQTMTALRAGCILPAGTGWDK